MGAELPFSGNLKFQAVLVQENRVASCLLPYNQEGRDKLHYAKFTTDFAATHRSIHKSFWDLLLLDIACY
jgi:hypothetical protein